MTPPPDETMETRVRLLETEAERKREGCDRFHACVYSFHETYKPQIESWVGLKKWIAGTAVVIILLAAGAYREAIRMQIAVEAMGKQIASIERKLDPLPTLKAVPPQEGTKPRPWQDYNEGMEAKP